MKIRCLSRMLYGVWHRHIKTDSSSGMIMQLWRSSSSRLSSSVMKISFQKEQRSYQKMISNGFQRNLMMQYSFNFRRNGSSLCTSIPDEDKPQIVFVLGGPGAGKGTHCSQIVDAYGFKHLSAGDLLREEMRRSRNNDNDKTDSEEFGEVIEKHIEEGTIVPASITCSLIEKAIVRNLKEGDCSNKNNKFFLVDGFPRNQDNLETWEEQMGQKVKMLFVLFFEVPEEVSIKRCLSRGAKGSGRADDNLEVIRKRLVTYHEDTLPIIRYYAKRNLLYSIDSSKSIDEVFVQVRKCFENALKMNSKRVKSS